VDDHPMVRERLALLIDQQPDLKVCGEASDVAEAVAAIDHLKPDVAVVDLALKSSSGLELIKEMRARGWDVPVLVLSMHEEHLYAERVLRAGALGYVSKQESTAAILAAIRRVLAREIHVSTGVAADLMKRMVTGKAGPSPSPVSRLADRELEIFQMIGRGHGTRRIAEHLGLSVKTVESYRARIKEKLQLDDGVQLLQRAALWVAEYDRPGQNPE
jgi:DNA-binding NarL/FixJ family response regulator